MEKDLGRKLTIGTYREDTRIESDCQKYLSLMFFIYTIYQMSYTTFVISNVKKKQYAQTDTF